MYFLDLSSQTCFLRFSPWSAGPGLKRQRMFLWNHCSKTLPAAVTMGAAAQALKPCRDGPPSLSFHLQVCEIKLRPSEHQTRLWHCEYLGLETSSVQRERTGKTAETRTACEKSGRQGRVRPPAADPSLPEPWSAQTPEPACRPGGCPAALLLHKRATPGTAREHIKPGTRRDRR